VVIEVTRIVADHRERMLEIEYGDEDDEDDE